MKRVIVVTALIGSMIACSKAMENSEPILTPEDQAKLFQEKNISDFGLAGTKKLALTFDDGPTPGVTDKLLDILAKERIQATFFLVGRNIPGREKLLKRMRNEGHIIANHSMRHLSLRGNKFMSEPENVIPEIEEAHDLIRPYLKGNHRLYFRAPHGAWSVQHPWHLNQIPKLKPYIGPVFWNIGGEMVPRPMKNASYSVTAETIQAAADWHCWSLKVSVAACYAGYMKEIAAKQGGVVLMHDVNIRTVEMVRAMIPVLKRRGYEFISLDDIDRLAFYQ